MKVRLLLIVAILDVVLIVASSASACETCFSDPNFPDLGYSCWSGYQLGYEYCYGGGAAGCNIPRFYDCPINDPHGIAGITPGTDLPESAAMLGVLGTSQRASAVPDGGFALELE